MGERCTEQATRQVGAAADLGPAGESGSDRQVVTRGPDQFSAWLDGTAGTDMLVPAPEEAIRYWPVSKRINKVSAPRDDKTLIEAVTLEPDIESRRG